MYSEVMPTGAMLNLKNFWKFWNLMVCQQSENLSIAPEVMRMIEHQQNVVGGGIPEMEFGFWQLCRCRMASSGYLLLCITSLLWL